MVKRGGQSAGVGEGPLKQVEEVFKFWHQLRDGEISRQELQAEIAPVERQVKALLKEGAGCEQNKTRHTCENVLMNLPP